MSKLPTEFVKSPSREPKHRAQRTRKASLISPEPVRDPHELVLHLTDEEYEALEHARTQLKQAGTEITLEQMIHRVFADWMLLRATPAAAERAQSAPAEPDLRARVRTFIAAPLRMWHELAGRVRRTMA